MDFAPVRRHWSHPTLRRRWYTAAVGLALTFVPLVGSLGYEHGFVLAPLAALGGVAVGVDAMAWARRSNAAFGSALLRGAVELAWLCLIALAMPLVGQLWQPACEPLGGLGFFAMGPVISAGLGLVAGCWGGALARRRIWALLLGATPMILCTAVALRRLYVDPVVFAYDPFWGYFSGSVYDEAVGLSRTYFLFRGYNLLSATAAALLLWGLLGPELRLAPWQQGRWVLLRGPVLAVAVLLGGVAATLGLRPGKMGFSADLDSITRVLAGTYETEHFILHYAPRSADARDIEAMAAEHEFAWHNLSTAMGGRAPAGKIRSLVFPNRDLKRRLMGAGTVQVAAPWRRQIYLDHRPFPHPVIQHELAHIFGATIGDGIFGASRVGLRLNVGLIEGFATAMAPREDDRLDLHDQAAVLGRLGKRPPMVEVMGPGFLTQSSHVAYTAAGSFCLWLIETRGFEPMAQLYRSAGDFAAAYGETLAALEAQWLEFLAAREGIRDEDVAAVAQRFQRSSVFSRPCAHRSAELRHDVERAQHRGDWDEALAAARELCRIEPDQPEHYLVLAHTLGLAQQWAEAAGALATASQLPELSTSLQAAIAERQGDLALVMGDHATAAQAYTEALTFPQSDRRKRLIQLRQAATSAPNLAPWVLEYLAPFDSTANDAVTLVRSTFAAAEISRLPDHEALGDYLLARQLLNVQQPGLALVALERVGEPNALPSTEFAVAFELATVEAAVQTGRWSLAEHALARLETRPGQGRGDALAWARWRDRIAFFRTYAASTP